jgi:hypothetical protein
MARTLLLFVLLLLFWLPGLLEFQFWFHALEAFDRALTRRARDCSCAKLSKTYRWLVPTVAVPIKWSLGVIVTAPNLPAPVMT